MDRANLITDHRISGRPIRAKYKHFRTIWEHTCDKSPTEFISSSLEVVVIDAGAAETVLPTDWFTGHELKETEESRGGQFYVCAGGREIPNYGERTLTLTTLDWSSVRNMPFQVTDVTKALGSVSKIVANGNKVVFDESGSFIENKRPRERLWMREKNGVYVLDVYVAPPDHHEKREFSQAGNSLASSPVDPSTGKLGKVQVMTGIAWVS